MILLLAFAFISGFVTILAPCIWPLLPIVLSSSIIGNSKSHKRPLGVTLGIMVSFAFFTLSFAFLVKAFNLDANILRIFAVIVIAFFGVAMIVPQILVKFELLVTKLTNLFGIKSQNQNNDFISGFITGISLGIVWSPCAGPILATIATLAATGQVTLNVVLVTIFYVIGVGIPLFLFAYAGQQFITKAKGVSKYTGRIQQVFGVIMILTAVAIYMHYDTYVEAKLLDAFPIFSQDLNKFEGNSLVTNQLNNLKGTTSTSQTTDANSLFNTDIPAPDFVGITKWLNTNKPITIGSLKGKVILVDFWTYTCINCIRTLPYVTSWYDKYKNQGFIVIGVHTPEFQFEHDTGNVLNAIKMYNIHYPVAQDNNYLTWNNYNNQYWPAEYLIDANGNIRRENFGEGDYDKTEEAIQTLLKDAGKKVNQKLSSISDETPKDQLSPESYLGSQRMLYLSGVGKTNNGSQSFTLDSNLQVNSFSFVGNWNITDEYALSANNSALDYNFYANKVYLVITPKNKGDKVKVMLDGKVIPDSQAGSDVKNGEITLDEQRLYNITDIKNGLKNHLLHLEFEALGTKVYAFTFGE